MEGTVDIPPSPRRPLGLLLLDRGLITPGQLREALAEQERTGWRLGEILVHHGWLSLASLHAALAQQHGLDLDGERSLRRRLRGVEGDGARGEAA